MSITQYVKNFQVKRFLNKYMDLSSGKWVKKKIWNLFSKVYWQRLKSGVFVKSFQKIWSLIRSWSDWKWLVITSSQPSSVLYVCGSVYNWDTETYFGSAAGWQSSLSWWCVLWILSFLKKNKNRRESAVLVKCLNIYLHTIIIGEKNSIWIESNVI